MAAMKQIAVALLVAGCVGDGPQQSTDDLQSAPQPVPTCADAGLWRVDVICWHHIQASRSVYIDVAAGDVIAPTIVDLGPQIWTTPSGVDGVASVDAAGACRIDLSWSDLIMGDYSVTVYPHAGNEITGAGSAGPDTCEVTAHRQVCLLSGPPDVICPVR